MEVEALLRDCPKVELEIQRKPLNEKAPMCGVVMINDDYTPMEFVVSVLETVFHINSKEATRLMLQAHYNGKVLCGIYPREIAETKAVQVVDTAHKSGHPLLCVAELE